MSDQVPPKDQQDLEIPLELQQLERTIGAPRAGPEEDTNISTLATTESIDCEDAREGLRIKREKRKAWKAYRYAFVTLIALAILIVLTSIAVVVHGLASNHELVPPALGSLGGGGGLGYLVWRAYGAMFK